MVTEFDRLARGRIARLRHEADRLERSLGPASELRLGGAGGRPENSALIALLPSIREAGDRGLSVDEMVAAAKTLDLTVKRRELQAQARKARQAGWLADVEPGRYALAEPERPPVEGLADQNAPDEQVAIKKPEPFPPN